MRTRLFYAIAAIAATFTLASCEKEDSADLYKDVKLEIKAPTSINVLETANLEYVATKNGVTFDNAGKYIYMDCDGLTRLGVTIPGDCKYAWTPTCAGKYTLWTNFGDLATSQYNPSAEKVLDVYGPLITLYTKNSKIKVNETIVIEAAVTDYYDGQALTDVKPMLKCESAPAASGLSGKVVSENGRYELTATADGAYKFIAYRNAYNGIEFWQREVTITVEK